jgi:hypothetical protein
MKVNESALHNEQSNIKYMYVSKHNNFLHEVLIFPEIIPASVFSPVSKNVSPIRLNMVLIFM